jgi:hypothetical protein
LTLDRNTDQPGEAEHPPDAQRVGRADSAGLELPFG